MNNLSMVFWYQENRISTRCFEHLEQWTAVESIYYWFFSMNVFVLLCKTWRMPVIIVTTTTGSPGCSFYLNILLKKKVFISHGALARSRPVVSGEIRASVWNNEFSLYDDFTPLHTRTYKYSYFGVFIVYLFLSNVNSFSLQGDGNASEHHRPQ